MQTRVFGVSGVPLPVIGQGTWEMERDRDPVAALRRGLDRGMIHIDTAEMYGAGRVEEIVGRAIAGRRDEVFLVSKVLPSNASREGTVRACERSLRRLGTDRLDCYLLHWPGSHALEDTIAAFEELHAAGKILSYGVSNFDAGELNEAVRIAGAGRIACDQVLYHAGERTVENTLAPCCVGHGVALVAYSPLGQGNLPDAGSVGGRALARVAAARGVSVHQVALRFVVRAPGSFAIPKASDPRHVDDNAAAGDWQLDEGEIAQLEAACPRSKRMRGIPML